MGRQRPSIAGLMRDRSTVCILVRWQRLILDLRGRIHFVEARECIERDPWPGDFQMWMICCCLVSWSKVQLGFKREVTNFLGKGRHEVSRISCGFNNHVYDKL